jgi:hypothetical protein
MRALSRTGQRTKGRIQNPEVRSQKKRRTVAAFHSGFWILAPDFCFYRLLFPLHTLGGQDDAFAVADSKAKWMKSGGISSFSLRLSAEYYLLNS